MNRPRSGRERLIAALDVPEPDGAARLAAALRGRVGLFKVGLELFVAHGRSAVEAVAPLGALFLDLKLHDIPRTVESAARGAGALGASLVTVHASGGAAMVEAARRGLQEGAQGAGRPVPRLLAVTVLTSLGEEDLEAVGLRGPAREAAVRLARLSIAAGADGVVCSTAEVATLREALGPAPLLVVPGIRPRGAAAQDQKRIGTAAEAMRAGADYLVVGRPLRDASDPGAAADSLAREIDGA